MVAIDPGLSIVPEAGAGAGVRRIGNIPAKGARGGFPASHLRLPLYAG